MEKFSIILRFEQIVIRCIKKDYLYQFLYNWKKSI